jgi:group II intron reverse transcriptase/maturase
MTNRKDNFIMHELRESDSPIVSKKRPNNGGEQLSFAFPSAEAVEKRGLVKGNEREHPKVRTQRRVALKDRLARIRKVSKNRKTEQLTALLHHVYHTGTLKSAFESLKRNSAPGIDSVTWQEYQEHLDARLDDLSHRVQVGTYRPEPVLRAFVPKTDGGQRPIGIPVIEDKIVEKAMVMVLNQVYEEEFKNFSYGFRPGRHQHKALDAVTVALEQRPINWILDADIQGFFDNLSHDWLLMFLRHRIADKRVLRLIKRWLKAGVMEDGTLISSDEGTPQGGSISPLLANIYLHYVLDQWVDWWRRHKARGQVIIVRYADDFIVGFQHHEDATEFRSALEARLKKFNLSLNTSKTRLIEFGRHATKNRAKRGEGKPETFDFLGFTHICARSPKGYFCVHRHTSDSRLRRKLKELNEQLRYRRHWKVRNVGLWLRSVLIGHYRYYGVPYNWGKMIAFFNELVRAWFRQLIRRSHKRKVNWARMEIYKANWLPLPHYYHGFPSERLVV